MATTLRADGFHFQQLSWYDPKRSGAAASDIRSSIMKDSQTGLFLNKIPYVRVGSGPKPIVVLNGGQAFVRRPTPERALRDARRIARLLPRNRTIYILGYDPFPPADQSIDMIVGDISRILLDEVGPATVMGISFGGFVATRLAAEHPGLVREMILMVSAHPSRRRAAAASTDRSNVPGEAISRASSKSSAWCSAARG